MLSLMLSYLLAQASHWYQPSSLPLSNKIIKTKYQTIPIINLQDSPQFNSENIYTLLELIANSKIQPQLCFLLSLRYQADMWSILNANVWLPPFCLCAIGLQSKYQGWWGSRDVGVVF